ncbi:MAG: hypothetical protein WC763_06130 [Candidatus Paceibacterota bacterium]|jgi:hypothetical protein
MRKETDSLLSTAPYEETCAQVGDDDYVNVAKAEASRFRDLLITKLGPPPPGFAFKNRWREHDFGSYLEVEVQWEPDDPVGRSYALACIDHGPSTWDDKEPFDWRSEYGL